VIAGGMRKGDIRHCFPDLSAAERDLGYRAQTDYDAGLAELAEWVARQQVDQDKVVEARRSWNAGVGRVRPILVTGGAGFIGSNLADRLAGPGPRRPDL
jgi:nucleoside-diphosphate-sugar epimerase